MLLWPAILAHFFQSLPNANFMDFSNWNVSEPMICLTLEWMIKTANSMPVSAATLLILGLYFVFIVIGALFSDTWRVYYHFALLDMQYHVGGPGAFKHGRGKALPSFLVDIPYVLFRVHAIPSEQKQRHGKCSGHLEKLNKQMKKYLVVSAADL